MRQPKTEQSVVWAAKAEYFARLGADPEDVEAMASLARVYREMEDDAIREKRKEPVHRCGARTRKGTPCIRKARANGRCPNHGGMSTGPKTEEGKRRIAEAQRARWAKWRESREVAL